MLADTHIAHMILSRPMRYKRLKDISQLRLAGMLYVGIWHIYFYTYSVKIWLKGLHMHHDLGPVLWLLLLQRQGADHCGKGDNRNSWQRQGATRDNRRCHSWKSVFKRWFVSFQCILLSWPLRSESKVATLIFWKGTQDHHLLRSSSSFFHLSLIRFSSWHPQPLKLESISSS